MFAIVTIVVMLLFSVASLALVGRLYTVLERKHPSVYEAMERPSVSAQDRKDPYQKALLTFIYKRQYQALDDPEINRIGSFLFWFWPTYMGVVGILAFVSFVALVRNAT